MSRVRIELPEKLSFSTAIPIRITDLNYGGHVGNDSILSLLHEARVQYLAHHGFSEMDFCGVGLIMSDASIEFKQEIFYGDQLKAYVGIANISKVGFTMFYKLVKNKEEALVALAKTGMVCYNYGAKKIATMPEKARQAFNSI